MSHDSRGALLKKGDRVLVEGVLVEDPTSDGGYCNAQVKFVTPDQREKPPMEPPGNVFNTRMLTKVGALLLVMFIGSCSVGSNEADGRGPLRRVLSRPFRAVAACRGGNCAPQAKRSAPACRGGNCLLP